MPLTHLLAYSLTHSLTYSLTGLLTYSLTYSLTLLTHSLTHSPYLLTHSLTLLGIVTTSNSLDHCSEDDKIMLEVNATVKDMEAAAIAWITNLNKLPFFAVKVLTHSLTYSLTYSLTHSLIRLLRIL